MTPQFWKRVRKFNWIVGGIGLAVTGALFVSSYFGLVDKKHPIMSVMFSPDNSLLLGRSLDARRDRMTAEFHGWDVRTGRRLWTEAVPTANSAEMALMPDGKTFVTAIQESFWGRNRDYLPHSPGATALRLQLRDLRTGAVLQTSLPAETDLGIMLNLNVAPNGKRFAVAFQRGIRIWDAEGAGFSDSGSQWRPVLASMPLHDFKSDYLGGARFAADSRHVVVSYMKYVSVPSPAFSYKLMTKIYDSENESPVVTIGPWESKKAPHDRVTPDRRYILSAVPSPVGTKLTLWDAQTGRRHREVQVPANADVLLQIYPAPNRSASSGESTPVYRIEGLTNPADSRTLSCTWDAEPNQTETQFSPRAPLMPYRTYSSDGQIAAVPGNDGARFNGSEKSDFRTQIYDAQTGQPLQRLEVGNGLW